MDEMAAKDGAAERRAWASELARPTAGFFPAFAALARCPGGAREASLATVRHLAPAVDWAGYLPHLPTGLHGLWAVWRLRPLLAEASFHRALALQLHAFAHEARRRSGGLAAIAKGSGSWANLEAAHVTRRPSLAYGEALGVAKPDPEAFRRLLVLGLPDMACMGLKGSAPWFLGDLWARLDRPAAEGRQLLALSAWLVAAEPADLFWHQRAAARLPAPPVAVEPAAAAREVCDLGLVALLDRWSPMAAGLVVPDLLAALALAAAERMLDARRDLEGKTSGLLLYLAALAGGLAACGRPEPFVQAAALVNLFPGEEPEERVRPRVPKAEPEDPAAALLEAILDAEPQEAMHLAGRVQAEQDGEALLRVLAEAASRNDPGFNHSAQLLATAAAAELAGALPKPVQAAVQVALAKSLANSQGSADLARQADRALAGG